MKPAVGPKVVAIVQARMGSSRLPGKIMQDIAGEPMLGRMLQRLKRSKYLSQIVVATTDQVADDAVVSFCESQRVYVFRGSENDVLDRYRGAAEASGADVVVRITSDCPLIDPSVTDKTIGEFLSVAPDYASNAIVRTFPRGLDTEVVTRSALMDCWKNAKLPYQRAHVTPYIYEHPELFRLHAVKAQRDYSNYRWTVDTPEDLAFVQAVYANLGSDGDFGWTDILRLLTERPELAEMNANVSQKPLREG